MRRIAAIAYALAFCVTGSALAAECTNPNALGTHRTLVIDNSSHPKLGAQQYDETLPLADREVVLTFDDGPLGPYTNRILDLLAAECVKATYFLVGTMAQSNPELVKRIQREGHTVGTHSRSHPLTFDSMPLPQAEQQIDGGIAMVKEALGSQGQLAPFFRFPGLLRSNAVETLLAQRSLVTWSVDLVADDWHRGITADDIAKRALRRIESRGRGILLLHDIHPATALAMPAILKGLKAGGYRIVHVAPASAMRPKTYSEPQQWAAHAHKRARVMLASTFDPSRSVPTMVGPELLAVLDFAPPPEAQQRQVLAAAGDDFRLPRTRWAPDDRAAIPDALASATAGNDAIDWPGAVQPDPVSPDGAIWPAVKRDAEPAGKSVVQSKPATPAARSCRGERCNKPLAGHQLSLSGIDQPDRLKAFYQF